MLFSKDYPLFPNLDFGLWARVFSAVFLSLEPTIHFFHWSAVSHLKSRDFRLPMSPRSPFAHWSAVAHTGNDMTSSSGHVIALDQSGASLGPIRAQLTTIAFLVAVVTLVVTVLGLTCRCLCHLCCKKGGDKPKKEWSYCRHVTVK